MNKPFLGRFGEVRVRVWKGAAGEKREEEEEKCVNPDPEPFI